MNDKQAKIRKERIERVRPWQYKKGQSGNPAGRPVGKSLKEYSREKLAGMTEEERELFLHGLSKDTIWEMAEGKAKSNIDLKTELDEESRASIAELTEFFRSIGRKL